MKYCMAIGLLGSMTLQAMAQYTGKVFVDENRNGLLDEGEKRLHRVSVSDGLNVVQTCFRAILHTEPTVIPG